MAGTVSVRIGQPFQEPAPPAFCRLFRGRIRTFVHVVTPFKIIFYNANRIYGKGKISLTLSSLFTIVQAGPKKRPSLTNRMVSREVGMSKESPLKDKVILVVDDEPDVLETVEDELDMAIIHKAKDYDTALQYLLSYTYDVVILDIMGVNGFELLKTSVERNFPALMLTAHALTPEALKKSIKLGAVSFLPKERLSDLKDFLEDVVLGEGKPLWIKFFDKFSNYFNKRFGPDWKERDIFFKDFEESLRKSEAG
jgi:CheY-like chemotaxis protein